jgi:hypothetical protein
MHLGHLSCRGSRIDLMTWPYSAREEVSISLGILFKPNSYMEFSTDIITSQIIYIFFESGNWFVGFGCAFCFSSAAFELHAVRHRPLKNLKVVIKLFRCGYVSRQHLGGLRFHRRLSCRGRP